MFKDNYFWINYIIADHIPVIFGGRNYFLSTPSREARFIAEQLFSRQYEDAVNCGLYTDEDIAKLLCKFGYWNEEKEQTLNKLVKDIEDINLWIFESYTMSDRRKHFKKALIDTNNYIDKLLQEKQIFDSFSAKSVANYARQHYMIGSSIYKSKNKPLFVGNWFSCKEDEIIQHCYKVMYEYILSDQDYRKLARSNEWRNIYSVRKGSNIFGRAAVDLSIPQRQLSMWSGIYDNVYKSSECPPDEIIEDDDALNGWFIKQKRDRESNLNKNTIENSLTNERIRNSDEVFILCDQKDAKKVYDCNDFTGKMRWNSIMKQVKQEGVVNCMALKDTQSEFMRQLADRSY